MGLDQVKQNCEVGDVSVTAVGMPKQRGSLELDCLVKRCLFLFLIIIFFLFWVNRDVR